MIGRDVVRLLRAHTAGKPLPRGQAKGFAIVDDQDLLVLAFLRMGGESRPWAIAYGHPNEEPTILAVPEGRNRDLVADMCAEFAPILLAHLNTPGFVAEDPGSWEDLRPLRQIWVPNGSHLDMLHHLTYAYTFTKWGAGARGVLNALGRATGWLFREAQRPGEQHVMVATEVLRTAYTFPAQNTRQGHLGFLLAWLKANDDSEARSATALEAERLAVSSSIDPFLERDEMEAMVEKWGRAREEEDEKALAEAEAGIRAVLEAELERRYRLTVEAIQVLRADERRTNLGVGHLVTEGLKEQWYQCIRLALNLSDDDDGPAFTPSPETDRYPAAAASRYFVHLASDDLLESLLLHDDLDMLGDVIARGDGFCGEITDVEDIGEGRATRPVWTIVVPHVGPLKLRESSWVAVVGLPNRKGELISVTDEPGGIRTIVVEITGWKTRPSGAPPGTKAANDSSLIGTRVTMVKYSADQISRRKSRRVWSAEVPGSWLTHAQPIGPRAVVIQEASEPIDRIGPIYNRG
jgi:hypothetical protein